MKLLSGNKCEIIQIQPIFVVLYYWIIKFERRRAIFLLFK